VSQDETCVVEFAQTEGGRCNETPPAIKREYKENLMQTPMREKVEDVSHDETRAVERTENGFDETPPASERESLMATPTREQVEEMLTFCKEQRDWFENRACSLEEERDKAFASNLGLVKELARTRQEAAALRQTVKTLRERLGEQQEEGGHSPGHGLLPAARLRRPNSSPAVARTQAQVCKEGLKARTRQLVQQGAGREQIMEELGISKASYHRYLTEVVTVAS